MRTHPDFTTVLGHSQDFGYQKTIDQVSAIPPEERSPKDVLLLIQAVLAKNEWHTPSYLKLLEDLPAMIKSLRPHRQMLNLDNTTLDMLLGKAYYQLGEYRLAKPLLEKAQKKLQDPQIDGMIEECSYAALRPPEKETFRERTAKAWAEFAKHSEELHALILDKENRKSQKKAAAILKQILGIAFHEPTFSFGHVAMPWAWVQLNAYSKTQLLQTLYFVRRAPKRATKDWLFYAGHPSGTYADVKEIQAACHGEVYEQVVPEENGQVQIKLYCPDSDKSVGELERNPNGMEVVRTILGSLVQTTLVSEAYFAKGQPPEDARLLEEMPYDLHDRNLANPFTIETLESLEFRRFPTAAEECPDEELMQLERAWRQDFIRGYTVDPKLDPEYEYDMCEVTDWLAGSGAIPGFAVFPHDVPKGQRFQVLAELTAELEKDMRPSYGAVLGYAEGTHFGYLDVLAFDFPSVQTVLRKLLKRHKYPWACWHSFARFDRTIPIF